VREGGGQTYFVLNLHLYVEEFDPSYGFFALFKVQWSLKKPVNQCNLIFPFGNKSSEELRFGFCYSASRLL